MNNFSIETNAPTGFLRLEQVLKLIPVSKATWWSGCKTGQFPKPFKLAPRITAWRVCDIQSCIENFRPTRDTF